MGVIFGGISTEHEVSIVSGTSVIENLNKDRYDITPIYITKEGEWKQYTKPVQEIKTVEITEKITQTEPIENVMGQLKALDVLFPVLHGRGGEDGTIQGIFELVKVPYVGCGVLASSVGMDKIYTKLVFEKAGIRQAKYAFIRKEQQGYVYIDKNFNETVATLEEISKIVEQTLPYPMFVKPSNSGSSVGIAKAKDQKQLQEAIAFAGQYDRKIVIEEGINAREIECAVLGKEQVDASCVGEILPAEEFYSFDAKYTNAESKVVIPAKVENEIAEEIRRLAVKAFKAIDGKGLSRVDFFVEKETNTIYLNEINTLPGFTKISMYPKLFAQVGISYTQLLDKLIALALEKE